MKNILRLCFVAVSVLLITSCSTQLSSLQSPDEGGAVAYQERQQPIPPMPAEQENLTTPHATDAPATTQWKLGQKIKGWMAAISPKRVAKQLIPKDNLASEKGQHASVFEILLIIILVLLILALLRFLGFGFLDLLISLAVLVLLILLILYLLGEL